MASDEAEIFIKFNYRNPIVKFRNSYSLTRSEFAFKSGLNTQTVYLNECGVYKDILPSLRGFIRRLDPYADIDQLRADYKNFVKEKRHLFGKFYLVHSKGLPDIYVGRNPIKLYREHLGIDSRTSMCKGICVQPSTLYRLEKVLTKELSDQFKTALLGAGLSTINIEELNYRYLEHYEQGFDT